MPSVIASTSRSIWWRTCGVILQPVPICDQRCCEDFEQGWLHEPAAQGFKRNLLKRAAPDRQQIPAGLRVLVASRGTVEMVVGWFQLMGKPRLCEVADQGLVHGGAGEVRRALAGEYCLVVVECNRVEDFS
jgi:hypothetical protein